MELRDIVEIVFLNDDADATTKIIVIHAARDSVRRIVQWYGAFHAGDKYIVAIDRQKADIDHNGELIDPNF